MGIQLYFKKKKMKKKVVVFVVSSLNSGGIENYLLRFIKYYNNKFDVVVYCKNGIIGDLEEEYLKLGANIFSFKMGYLNIFNCFKFYKIIRKLKPQVVCDFTGNFAGIILFLAKLANIKKRIVFYRGSNNHFKEDYLRLFYNSLMNKLVYIFATDILSNSLSALNYFFPNRDKLNNKFEVIYNGIDSKSFCMEESDLRDELLIANDKFIFGHIGRYNIAKNHDTIIKVAIELCKSNPNTYFIFCGRGVDSSLNNIVKAEKLTEQIKLLGYRSDVIKVLNTLDAFYFPSITEGQPNSLIEAMIVGLPFVASNIEPIKETVPKNMYSQLVDPFDVDIAVKKLEEIRENPILRSKLDCSNWAKDNFNAELLFKKFKNRL